MVQVRSRRTLGDAQRLSDLGVREPFYVMQHQHRSHSLRQLRHRLTQPPMQLICLGRISERSSQRLMQLVRCSDLSPPRKIERGVRDDPVQPRPEGLFQIEPIERLIRPDECFLDGILRILMYCDDCPRHSVSTLGVYPDKHAERRLVALLGRGGKGPLVRRITRRLGHALNRGDRRGMRTGWKSTPCRRRLDTLCARPTGLLRRPIPRPFQS